MTHQSVAYITSKANDDCLSITQELSSRTGINFTKFTTIGELFTSLSNPRFSTDLIIVNLEGITKVEGADLFDIISTISTLIKCTVQRTKPGKPVKRHIPIAVAADLTTDLNLFKQIAGTDVIGVYPCGNKFTVEDKITALTALIAGQHYMPGLLAEKIKPSKKKPATKSTITLTARQAQILQLICDRGASNKVIAHTLKISESTVKLHITAVLKKYGVRNRTQLALFANKQKQLQPV
jgi:DNA-binding CsgD family transcriptional regulator